MRDVVILGSTGSIGTQALEVVRGHPDRFRVVGLAAGGADADTLARQAREFAVEVVAIARPGAAAALAEHLGPGVRVLAGADGVAEAAAWPCDVVLNGITGSVGLAPSLAALGAGRVLALANKESVVAGGPLILAALGGHPERLVPVDSEHSALAQCLRAGRREEVSRLVLTASGGPFRGWTSEMLAAATPAQALAHPTWSMGPDVTVNSATLMNKGLETIEAHVLFGVPYERIDVVVHPSSIVHSLVEFTDGASLAQLSVPDMRLPIALALSWPSRLPGAVPGLDWRVPVRLDFEPLDTDAFPAPALARAAGRRGGVVPAALNAANEVAVHAFLAGRLAFPAIVEVVAEVVAACPDREAPDLAEVFSTEEWARARAHDLVTKVGIR